MNEFLASVKQRNSRDGIVTADRYFRSIEGCFNGGFCPNILFSNGADWPTALKEAESRLTFSLPEFQFDTKSFDDGTDIGDGIRAVVDGILTTTKQDRDGDILQTKGAAVDKNMPFLWQHIPLSPIGGLKEVLRHTDDMLLCRFFIVDTELGRDAAMLIKAGALRLSHGFQPTDIEPMKDAGWLIKAFEIFEGSAVSIPSNVGAVFTSYSDGKFHHPLVKQWAKKLYDERPTTVNVSLSVDELRGLLTKDVPCSCQKGSSGSERDSGDAPGTEESRSVEAVEYIQTPTIEDEHRSFVFFSALERVKDLTRGDDEFVDLGNEAHRAVYRQAFGMVRGSGVQFGDYDFLHHDVIDGEFQVHKGRVRRLIAQVNGAFGGVGEDIEVRQALYDHLAQHMKDWGELPPLFKKDAEAVVRQDIQLDVVLEGCAQWVPAELSEYELSEAFNKKAPNGSARTPKYSGTESTSWGGVNKSLSAYIKGYNKHKGGSVDTSAEVTDLPSAAKSWIASKTLLGNPSADNSRDLIFFPVVNPGTNKLNEGALKAVLGGRGSQANIPASALESAQQVARRLLKSKFGMEERSKAGRVLSEKSAAVVKEAIGDITVALSEDLSASVKAVLERASKRLSELLAENDSPVTFESAESLLLGMAAFQPSERLERTLRDIEEITASRRSGELVSLLS